MLKLNDLMRDELNELNNLCMTLGSPGVYAKSDRDRIRDVEVRLRKFADGFDLATKLTRGEK